MIKDLIRQHEDGFYVFNRTTLIENYDNLYCSFNNYFPDFSIAYSFKTNYTPQLCKLLLQKGAMAEVVSEMELKLALKLGFLGNEIIFNGPFKSRKALENALKNDVIIHIDSVEEILILLDVINKLSVKKVVYIGIRTNFDMHSKKRSRFGIDVDGVEFSKVLELISGSEFLTLKGLHCHHPFRELETFSERIEKIVTVCKKFSIYIDYIDIGGGFYGPLPNEFKQSLNIEAPNFKQYAETVFSAFSKVWDNSPFPKIVIEPGSALVANTFEFYTRVVSIKQIGTKNIASVSGSKFNILPNAKHTINLPIEILPVDNLNRSEIKKNYDICGYTCIENDVLYENFYNTLEVGDFICFKNVGSYSIVMKPPFILPNYPIYSTDDSQFYFIAKKEETFDYIFQNFNF